MSKREVITVETFNIEKLRFGEQQSFDKPVQWSQLKLLYEYPSKKIEPLRFAFGPVFSFGLKYSNEFGWSISCPLWNENNGPTEKEEKTYEVFKNLFDEVESYVKENYKSLSGRISKKTEAGLAADIENLHKKLNLNQDRVDKFAGQKDVAPILRMNIFEQKARDGKPWEMKTNFYNNKMQKVDYNELMEKKMRMKCTVLISGVTLEPRLSLSIRLCDAVVEVIDNSQALTTPFSDEENEENTEVLEENSYY